LDYEGDLNAVTNCDLVVNKMSFGMRFRWARYLTKYDIDQPNLCIVDAFLQDEVKTHEWLMPQKQLDFGENCMSSVFDFPSRPVARDDLKSRRTTQHC
jgi:hypothetical protein